MLLRIPGSTAKGDMMKWLKIGMVLVIACAASGCKTQFYSECQPPEDELKVLFKKKSSTNPFSHSFCVVCNPEIEQSEYNDWAESMGANILEAEDLDTVHPCLYVYLPDNDPADSIDSLEQCETLICDGTADYADMVGKNQGNFDVTPLLSQEMILVTEEWMLESTPGEWHRTTLTTEPATRLEEAPTLRGHQ